MSIFHVTVTEREFHVMLGDDGWVAVNGEPLDADVRKTGERTFSILLNGRRVDVAIQPTASGYNVVAHGVYTHVLVESDRQRLLREYGGTASLHHHSMEIVAPMPALVSRVEVSVGDRIVPGQGLVVLEAMKMENEIKAHVGGMVKEIHVTKGETVDKGDILLTFET